MPIRNLISIEDVSPDWWSKLYSLCRDIIAHPDDYKNACNGKVLASLFFEPSTRTNYSFQSAMMRLGGSVFGFSDPSGTSTIKGETLADTVRMVSAYSDAVVIRHPREGAALAASMYSAVPVINAGDGGHMHPTQTLCDLTTIAQKRGDISSMRIGLCGDLLYGRTVHSLVLFLSRLPDITFYLISPPELRLPEYLLTYMRERKASYFEVTDMEDTLPLLDVLYMTRIQRERFQDAGEYERLRGVYILTRDKLRLAREELFIMHPLPRVDEIAPDVDDDPRAVYFEQARYGMFIRMALLLRLCHEPREVPLRPADTGVLCPNPVCITRTEPYLPRVSGDGPVCGYCDHIL